MGSHYYFRKLKDHGEKLWPFTQAKAQQTTPEGRVGQGACVGVTVDWLQEKLWKPVQRSYQAEGWGRRFARRRFQQNGKRYDKHSARAHNQNTMREATRDQIYFEVHSHPPMTPFDGTDALLAYRGLSSERVLPPPAPGEDSIFERADDWKSNSQSPLKFVDSIVKALGDPRFDRKTGMLITLGGTHTNVAHTIAFYKSGSRQLYFFDSNCGAYKIRNGEQRQFLEAWKAGAERRWRGTTLRFVPETHHAIEFVSKARGLRRPPRTYEPPENLWNPPKVKAQSRSPTLVSVDMDFAPPRATRNRYSPPADRQERRSDEIQEVRRSRHHR